MSKYPVVLIPPAIERITDALPTLELPPEPTKQNLPTPPSRPDLPSRPSLPSPPPKPIPPGSEPIKTDITTDNSSFFVAAPLLLFALILFLVNPILGLLMLLIAGIVVSLSYESPDTGLFHSKNGL